MARFFSGGFPFFGGGGGGGDDFEGNSFSLFSKFNFF